MAVDAGMVARIEAAFVARLQTLTYNDVNVFRAVDHWRGQIAAGKSGYEAFDRYAPFAFVNWRPEPPAREGDYDLNRKLTVAVAIGQTSKKDGDARIGSGTQIGISLIHSLVINLFEGWHPGIGFTCDDFYYTGDNENYNQPKRCAVEIYFTANYLKTE